MTKSKAGLPGWRFPGKTFDSLSDKAELFLSPSLLKNHPQNSKKCRIQKQKLHINEAASDL